MSGCGHGLTKSIDGHPCVQCRVHELEEQVAKLAGYCRDHGEISTGKLAEYIGWSKSDVIAHDSLVEENKRLREALSIADECMVSWLNSYASELCNEKTVAEVKGRIKKAGGTLSYIGTNHQMIRKALGGWK